MYEIETLTGLCWVDETHTRINALAKFADFPDPLPFTFAEEEWPGLWPDLSEGRHGPVAEFIAVEAASTSKHYSKRRLFDAMTTAEYGTFETVEAQQSAKDRRVFREALELVDSDPGFPMFFGLMTAVYGAARTAQLLAAAEH